MKYVKHAIFIFAIAVLLAGCANTREDLVRTNVAFNQSVSHAIQLKKSGVIDDETAKDITPYINRGSDALDAAWTAYLLGKPDNVSQSLHLVNQMLLQLIDTTKETNNAG